MSIAIADYKRKRPVEIDLWGYIFEYIPVTKKTEPKINEALAQINKDFAGEDLSKHATQAKVFGARMDVRLKKSPGGKKRASTLIKGKWTADNLTIPQCDQFWEAVEEAVESPTSNGPVAIDSFAAATVDIDLWGVPFEAVKVTCSTEPEIDAKLKEVSREFAGKQLTHELQVQIFGARFDARLKPAEGGAAASEIVRDKWEADEVEVPQLQQFWDAVLEAVDPPFIGDDPERPDLAQEDLVGLYLLWRYKSVEPVVAWCHWPSWQFDLLTAALKEEVDVIGNHSEGGASTDPLSRVESRAPDWEGADELLEELGD